MSIAQSEGKISCEKAKHHEGKEESAAMDEVGGPVELVRACIAEQDGGS